MQYYFKSEGNQPRIFRSHLILSLFFHHKHCNIAKTQNTTLITIIMLRLIETNAMTMKFMFHGNKDETKPFLLDNIDSIESMNSKRLGLGKFSRTNNLNNDGDCGNSMAIISPTPIREESSCSTPRRISFFQDTENTRKTKKTIRFVPQLSKTNDGTDGSASKLWKGALTEEHCHELWYQKGELVAIKQAAKIAIANRSKIQDNPNASFEELDSLLGLERFSKRRALWKKSAIRCVLMAQGQMNELCKQTTIKNVYSNSINKEDYIQSISLRCTEWARNASEKQGFCDYCAVHDPLASLFSDSKFNSSEISLDDYKKEEEQNYNELIFGETTIGNNNTNSKKRKVGAVYRAGNEQGQVHSSRRRQLRAAAQLLFI
jgi:hypothetical protein